MIQTKDSNLTFRPLTIDDAEQYNALLRYAFQVTEQELSESGWKDDEIKQSKFPVLVRADVLGCFCDEDLVSQFAVYPLDMNIYGVRYPVGFVTSVCTYPEYTGQGIMKKLMIRSLTRMRENHRSFALLYPYSIPLYRNLGWEIISNKMTYTIKDTQVPRKLKAPGYVRRVAWDDKDFKELHTKFASKTHGCLYRNNLAWEEYFRWDEDDTVVAIYYSADDVPYGYMVYLISSDIMHIKEMIYLNREAQLGLWEYIHAHDCIVCSRKVNVLDSSCSICRVYDRFSFGTVVYRDTSLNCFFVGCIQSQRNIVKIALQQLNSPFHDVFSIILSRSDVYIKVNGTSVQLLFCSL